MIVVRPLLIAHRGAAQRAPENTVEAFADARRQGADGIEFDVRRTLDGVLVISHDPVLSDMTPIASLRAAALPATIPTLEEALVACAGGLINVEIKNDPREPGHDPSGALSAQVVEEIADAGVAGQVIISSFDLKTLDAVRRVDSTIQTGFLVDLAADQMLALDQAIAHGLDALHPFVMHVTPTLVAAAHEGGLSLNTWTVNAEADLLTMAERGVEAIITDDIPLALRTLGDEPTQ